MPGMEQIQDVNMGLVWIALLGLLIIYKGIDLAATRGLQRYDHRKGNGLQGTIKNLQRAIESLESKVADNPPYPPCHYDPTHFDRVRRADEGIAELLKQQKIHDRQMAEGRFTCKVHGDHLKTIQRLGDRLADGGKI